MQLVYNYCVLNHIQKEDYIFVREGKRPLRKEYLEDVFERQLKKAGIEKYTALFTIYIHYSDAPGLASGTCAEDCRPYMPCYDGPLYKSSNS